MLQKNQAVLVITGPTASGKTGLAHELAQQLDGAVINADSMQVYQDIPLITAQPEAALQAALPYHLYGYVPCTTRHNAAAWRAAAVDIINNVRAQGRQPIVVGGTGLYIKALLEGLAPIPPVPDAVLASANNTPVAQAWATLCQHDPAYAATIQQGDPQRSRRWLAVWQATGKPLSYWHGLQKQPLPLPYRLISLLPERAAVYQAIDSRLPQLIRAGAVDEVAALAVKQLSPALPAMKAVGVPELLAYINNKQDLATATAAAQQATRRYAKRQYTWLRHQLKPDLQLDTPNAAAVHNAMKNW